MKKPPPLRSSPDGRRAAALTRRLSAWDDAPADPRVKFTLDPPLPRHLIVDPVNVCTLACPLCPTGVGTFDAPRGRMSLADFRRLLAGVPRLSRLHLYNWGEPFLNADIFAMIALARARGVLTSLDSHFSLKRGDDFFRRIVESGLTRLRVSCDGASPATYAKYRVGGDFRLVHHNMRRLSAMRRRLRSASPRIVWKFLVHRHNEHEVARARRLARAAGVSLQVSDFFLADDLPDQRLGGSLAEKRRRWLPRRKEFVPLPYRSGDPHPFYHGPCPYLFSSMAVNSDGSVFPCCYASRKEHTFGNALETSPREVWTSEKYRYARSLFLDGPWTGRRPDVPCLRCPIFKARVPPPGPV